MKKSLEKVVKYLGNGLEYIGELIDYKTIENLGGPKYTYYTGKGLQAISGVGALTGIVLLIIGQSDLGGKTIAGSALIWSVGTYTSTSVKRKYPEEYEKFKKKIF